MDIDRRIVAQEFGEVRRRLMQPDAVDGAHANRSGDYRTDLAQPILQLHEAADDFLAGGIQNLAGRSRFDSRPAPFYQSAVVLFFEAADLLADCRLGDKILGGGIRKAPAFDYV